MGVVLGVNKVVLGRPDQNGIWELVRSTDADLGGHLIDPTGSGRRTEDGRWWWAADLERHLLAAAIETDHSLVRIALTENLPSWADRLSLRAERASTWSELRHLRKATGDPAVMPFARYMRAETGGKDGGPEPPLATTSTLRPGRGLISGWAALPSPSWFPAPRVSHATSLETGRRSAGLQCARSPTTCRDGCVR